MDAARRLGRERRLRRDRRARPARQPGDQELLRGASASRPGPSSCTGTSAPVDDDGPGRDGPSSASARVAVHDGDLLLIRRGHGPAAGQWSVPGGRVERGELLAEAVVREVREETGLEGVCGELVGWVERIDDATDRTS